MARLASPLILLLMALLAASTFLPAASTGLLMGSAILVSMVLLLGSLHVDVIVATLFSAVLVTGLFVLGVA